MVAGASLPISTLSPLTYSPVREPNCRSGFSVYATAGGRIGSRIGRLQDRAGAVWEKPEGRVIIPINERVIEAFRTFVRTDVDSQLTQAHVEADMDFVKLRLREEIVTAAFSNDAGLRVLLDSDPQVLRALEALPDAKRLAEMVRSGTSAG